MLQAGVFPSNWKFEAVSGKAVFRTKWTDNPLTTVEAAIQEYNRKDAYRGLGVRTGAVSSGLIAIDIDGAEADARFKQKIGEAYEAYGAESTMSWTSGRPYKRQVLYQVPMYLVKQLDHIHVVALDGDGEWCAQGVKHIKADGEKVEECALRFNRCHSVLPGSPHPDGGDYKFLNYNKGTVEPAPEWLMELLRSLSQPVGFLSEAELKELSDFATQCEVAFPLNQLRGIAFKDEVMDLLRPRFTDLVFRHETFQRYGWKERHSDPPQMLSGCPWHGGNSGTSFQFNASNGCWDCKACGIGGDYLDFMHKIATDNADAERPGNVDCERYVAQITTALGFKWPEDFTPTQKNKTQNIPLLDLSAREFLNELGKIYDSESNPAVCYCRMAALAADCGRRLDGTQCMSLLTEHRFFEAAETQNKETHWWKDLDSLDFVVPDLLRKPSQILLHADPGVGKTSAIMGLARQIGRGLPIKVRGIKVPVEQGPVLWIQSDQTLRLLKRDCENNDINPEKDSWFVVKTQWQINHLMRLKDWVNEIKPSVVVVDSIGSCSLKTFAEEKDKAFAMPLYEYANMNGNKTDIGFHACPIIWIHHNNAQGEARGTKYLMAAVDEQWAMRYPSERERELLRSQGKNPFQCRMIQIKKSRFGRQGDLLVCERSEDFSYALEDYTPTERLEGGGEGAEGDPNPMTTALRIVRDAQEAAEGPGGDGDGCMTAKEVWEALVGVRTGLGLKPPSSRTVKRWLERWVEDGMLVRGKNKVVPGIKQPVPTYKLPAYIDRAPRARSHVASNFEESSVDPRDRSDSLKKQWTNFEGSEFVHCSEGAEPNNGQILDPEKFSENVHCSPDSENSVRDCDLTEGAKEQWSENPVSGGTHARTRGARAIYGNNEENIKESPEPSQELESEDWTEDD